MMGFSQSHDNNNNNNNNWSPFSNSHPLVSSIITFFLLILLYFPRLFSTFLFSPILFLTAILLLFLLRLGATQRFSNDHNIKETKVEEIEKNDDDVLIETGSQDKANCTVLCFEEAFVEWNVRAPLEVIYEEDNDKDVLNETETETCTDTLFRHVGIERYPSLSLYYPETDSESSSDDEFPTPGTWDSLDNVCFMWDDDDDDEEKDELIEISLDKNSKKLVSEFQFEEENLIEIDISSMRNDEDFYR